MSIGSGERTPTPLWTGSPEQLQALVIVLQEQKVAQEVDQLLVETDLTPEIARVLRDRLALMNRSWAGFCEEYLGIEPADWSAASEEYLRRKEHPV